MSKYVHSVQTVCDRDFEMKYKFWFSFLCLTPYQILMGHLMPKFNSFGNVHLLVHFSMSHCIFKNCFFICLESFVCTLFVCLESFVCTLIYYIKYFYPALIIVFNDSNLFLCNCMVSRFPI